MQKPPCSFNFNYMYHLAFALHTTTSSIRALAQCHLGRCSLCRGCLREPPNAHAHLHGQATDQLSPVADVHVRQHRLIAPPVPLLPFPVRVVEPSTSLLLLPLLLPPRLVVEDVAQA